MKLLQLKCLFISFLSFNINYCQNLIKNGSFEEYSVCPDASGQLEFTVGWVNPVGSGTPDYYNACSSLRGVPSCCGDMFQYAKTGFAYVGVFTYNDNFTNVREYIHSILIDSLATNKCYFFSMYVNTNNHSSYRTNGLGVYFSDEQLIGSGSDWILNYTPQIYTESIIDDTLNWVQISGIYKPSSNNKYITIGNFFDDNSTDTVVAFSDLQRSAIYLIDDVELYQLGDGFAGKDSIILLGESIFIGQNVENLPSKWSILDGEEIATNVSGVLVSPTITTTYICEQNFCGEVMYDTIVVTVVDDAGLDTFDKNGQIRISPNPNNGTFTIDISKNIDIQELHLLDALSRKIKYLETNDSKIEVKLPSGVYFLELITENSRFLEKILIH